jgi:hypothetical protein
MASRGGRGVFGGIVPATDKEQMDDISYPEEWCSLESLGSAIRLQAAMFLNT